MNIGQIKQNDAGIFMGRISTLAVAMTIALTLLKNTEMAIPAAIYSIFMYVFAVLFGLLLNKFEPLPEQATA